MKVYSNEISVKKSKFVSLAYSIQNLSEASDILKQLQKEHKKAKHICYAYRINGHVRCHNSSKPNKVSLHSMLNPIIKNELNQILLVTIRYYGGVQLGASVLLRTYINVMEPCIKKFIEIRNNI